MPLAEATVLSTEASSIDTRRDAFSSTRRYNEKPNMSDREFLEVDPATLHLPGSRQSGADPVKLHRQIANYGDSVAGMPPLEVSRGTDGHLVINDGVTRATRVAKNLPGVKVPVEVVRPLPVAVAGLRTVRDRL